VFRNLRKTEGPVKVGWLCQGVRGGRERYLSPI
jgi:hypothetical protein